MADETFRPRTVTHRGEGGRPVYNAPTSRGAGLLVPEDDSLLDVDVTGLDDDCFPDGDAHAQRAARFLRDNVHDALPRFVDAWVEPDRSFTRYSRKYGRHPPQRVIVTRRTAGIEGSAYLRQHRLRGAGLPPAVALRIVERLADACRLAHASGVVHGGVLLTDLVIIRPDGRPLLTSWGSGPRRVGAIVDEAALYTGLQQLLRVPVSRPVPASDVFALGAMLGVLVSGAGPSTREAASVRYAPPSSRGAAYAWLDALVGRACDPQQGFALTAATLCDELSTLLAACAPPPDRVRGDLARGVFVSLAEHVACSETPDAGALREAVCAAVSDAVVAALAREQPVPRFTEVAIAVCPEARAVLRAFARDPSRPEGGRIAARRLLNLVDDAEALELALLAEAERPGSCPDVGWSSRPQFVTERGGACTHPFTRMRDVSVDASLALRCVCDACGPVESARSWLEGRRAPSVFHGGCLQFEMENAPGDPIVHQRLPRQHVILGDDESADVWVPGLDHADVCCLTILDPFRVQFTLGQRAYEHGCEVRLAVLDTRRPDALVRIGPVVFAPLAPGRVAVRGAPGSGVRLRPSMQPRLPT